MNIEEKIFKKLKENNFRISTAESVTGGKIASTLINVSGMSEFLKESYIVYGNEAKVKILKVKEETIDKFTVVSKELVFEMLKGLYEVTESEVCIATSGYAEDGRTSIFGIKVKDEYYIEENIYYGERNKIRDEIAKKTLEYLFRVV